MWHLQLGAFKVKQERLRAEGRDTSQVGQVQEQTVVGCKVTYSTERQKPSKCEERRTIHEHEDLQNGEVMRTAYSLHSRRNKGQGGGKQTALCLSGVPGFGERGIISFKIRGKRHHLS